MCVNELGCEQWLVSQATRFSPVGVASTHEALERKFHGPPYCLDLISSNI